MYRVCLINKYVTYHVHLNRVIMLSYIIYYSTYNIIIGLIMFCYFEILYFIMYYEKITYLEAFLLFCLSWILQFIGHYVEGRRPALFDSVGQAFLGAPLFSLELLIPQIKNYI